MEKGTHGIDEKTFAELSFDGQAKSINAQILSVERALNAHIIRAKKEDKEVKDINETKNKYKLQLERLIKGLK